MLVRNESSAKLLFTLLLVLLMCTACTSYNRQRGAENTWRTVDLSSVKAGATTQMDIAKSLGPPSQIINLNSGLVFYYLTETTEGTGYIFILFNQFKERVSYDRAVFFFNQEGVLIDYSLSKEAMDGAK